MKLPIISSSVEPLEHEDGSKPCVGLCYHNKVKALKNKGVVQDRGDENETIEVNENILCL